MNPYVRGTFWWARQEFVLGNGVVDESGKKYHAWDTDDMTLRAERWDTIFRFTVRDFEGRAWVLIG